MQVLDAVQNETVEIGHTASVYYSGKNRAFAIDTGLPFGMTPRRHLSWMYRGGGLELFREFFKTYYIVNFPGGSTGVQMGGSLRREVNTLNDLKGLKMRIPGIAGDVVARLGIVPRTLRVATHIPRSKEARSTPLNGLAPTMMKSSDSTVAKPR